MQNHPILSDLPGHSTYTLVLHLALGTHSQQARVIMGLELKWRTIIYNIAVTWHESSNELCMTKYGEAARKGWCGVGIVQQCGKRARRWVWMVYPRSHTESCHWGLLLPSPALTLPLLDSPLVHLLNMMETAVIPSLRSVAHLSPAWQTSYHRQTSRLGRVT